MFLEVPPWSPRFLLAHIHNLPIESAFVAEARGGQKFRGWNEDRYMNAALVNAVRTLLYAFILANIDPKKGKKPEEPKPWPVPDDGVKKSKQDKPGSFAHTARSMIAAIRKKRKEGGG